MRHERPAVVLPPFNPIELISPSGSVLGFPQRSIARVTREALGISHAVGPDGCKRTGPPDERIVRRDPPIVKHAVDLPVGAGEFLRVSRDFFLEAAHPDA